MPLSDKQVELHIKRLNDRVDALHKTTDAAVTQLQDLLDRCIAAGENHETQCIALERRIAILEGKVPAPPPIDAVYDASAETSVLDEERTDLQAEFEEREGERRELREEVEKLSKEIDDCVDRTFPEDSKSIYDGDV